MRNVMVIAECGSCHEGELDSAKRLVDAAKEDGADIAKFQYWSNAAKLAESRIRRGYKISPETVKLYRQYKMPEDWVPALKKHCEKMEIEFLCTGYLTRDIAWLRQFQDKIKLASFEHNDYDLHEKAKELYELMIVSRPDFYWYTPVESKERTLHCIPKYPARIEELRLKRFPLYTGLSDHTTSLYTGGYAVTLRASIVEKHIRLAMTSPLNPDYYHSLVAGRGGEFGQYVKCIREASVAIEE